MANIVEENSGSIKKCVICKKTMIKKYRPFCSKRCSDVDLNRWFGENYHIPSNEIDVVNDIYDDDNSEY